MSEKWEDRLDIVAHILGALLPVVGVVAVFWMAGHMLDTYFSLIAKNNP